ncbi:hypothetical protein [Bacillus pinisoli]|uniref:hypothetical protein n=1 Tax=Bacillus pinisoli TaxID=2901866 RepID=UPI001FF2AFC7|nr:hypothetical protein [Bacillus pinisoli]
MDKPRVTIKINGKERSFYEATAEEVKVTKPKEFPKPEQHEDREPPEFVYASELAEDEIAAANEEREFEWILPEHQEKKEFQYDKLVPIENKRKKPIIGALSIPGKKKSNHPKYPYKALILSILSALVIGTSFGMVVLHLFTEDGAQQAIGTVQPGETKEGEETDGTPANAPAASAPITIPAIDVFVVQGGVLSSAEAATPVIEDLKGKGFAGTVIQQDGKYLLFLGVGISDLAGKSMSTPYEAIGQDTYVKSFTFPEVSKEGDPAIQEAGKLLHQLVVFTSNKYTNIPETEAWANIKITYDQLASVESESNFVKAVKVAFPIVEAYQQSSADADFWKSQQALLTGLQEYQNWILSQKN